MYLTLISDNTLCLFYSILCHKSSRPKNIYIQAHDIRDKSDAIGEIFIFVLEIPLKQCYNFFDCNEI